MIELLLAQAQTTEVRVDFLKPSAEDTLQVEKCLRDTYGYICEEAAYLLDPELRNTTRLGIHGSYRLELSDQTELEFRLGQFQAEDWEQLSAGTTLRYQAMDLRLEAFVDHAGFMGSSLAIQEQNTFTNIGAQVSYNPAPWSFRLRAEQAFVSDGNQITQFTGTVGYVWTPWLRTEARVFSRSANFASSAYWSPFSYESYSLLTTAQIPVSETTGFGLALGVGAEDKNGGLSLRIPIGLGVRHQFNENFTCDLGGRAGYGLTVVSRCEYSL